MANDPVVETTSGKIQGRVVKGAATFLGVPYAAPPFGVDRFQAPRPHDRWDGIRPALDYGDTAPQPDRQFTLVPEPVTPGPECLNLNVVTPDPSRAAKLPVLVWIHGGGFTAGCNASEWYRGEAFAAKGVVTVAINYRLGAEGFLVLPDGAPHNRAVRDWVAALEWVRDNIAAFGGDPQRVTIAGQSAGGVACATLLVTPSAKGLFRAAWCMSGARTPTASVDDGLVLTRALAEEVGVEPTLAGLAGVDPAALADAQDAAGSRAAEQTRIEGRSGGLQLAFGPIVDGDVVPERGLNFDSKVAVVAGATANEFTATMKGLADSMDDERLARRMGRMGLGADAVAAYRAHHPDVENWWLYGQAFSDSAFKAGALRLAERWSAAGGRAWLYGFEWCSKSPAAFGSVHCIDIPFAFDNLDADGVDFVTGPNPPQPLADDVHAAMLGLVRDGDPGWPAYGPDRKAMVFDVPSAVAEDPWAFERRIWLSEA